MAKKVVAEFAQLNVANVWSEGERNSMVRPTIHDWRLEGWRNEEMVWLVDMISWYNPAYWIIGNSSHLNQHICQYVVIRSRYTDMRSRTTRQVTVAQLSQTEASWLYAVHHELLCDLAETTEISCCEGVQFSRKMTFKHSCEFRSNLDCSDSRCLIRFVCFHTLEKAGK